MAVPSRAFVGILVFALIASLAILPYTILVLSGYEAPPATPYEALFPSSDGADPGTKLALVLISVFCLAAVVAAWRGLVNGARLDRELREQRAAGMGRQPKKPAGRDDEPPGYQ